MAKLTQKQETFAAAYVRTGNATLAFKEAFNCGKMKETTIARRAHDLVHLGKIKARLLELNAVAVTAAVLSRTEALEILSKRARVNFFDLVEFGEYQTGVDSNGDPVFQTSWRIKNKGELTSNQLAAISEMTSSRKGISIKAHDPMAAIALLAKMNGWEAPAKIGLAGWDGGAIKTQAVPEMTDEQLAIMLHELEPKN